MLRGLSLTILFILLFCHLSGQEKWIDTQAGPLESIDRIDFSFLDNEKLRDKYGFYDVGNDRLPHIFAEAITTDITTESKGTWESSVQGYLIWRQRITSKDAYSLNLGFTDFFLPPSASLFLSDGSRNNVIGPITQKDNDAHNEWWSPIIPGDDAIIEIQIDPKEVNQLRLHLTKVNHDFAGFGAVISESCNLDAICGDADGFGIVDRYRDILNSVGQMLIQGRFQCTGSLVNNTRQDCTPYIITAEHCGITESTAASVVIYWDFQNTQCRQPNSLESGGSGDGSRDQFNSGAQLIAKYDQTDFTLVELDDPVDPLTTPYYTGWDRATEVVDSAIVIHHPSGDEKRISFDYDSLIFNVERNFVQVSDWDIGTTEQGSSGSPLFTKAGLVVGYLSAGDAACGNDLEDDFGMIKMSWEGGGTPETRLKDWLDPINSGITLLTGRFCSDVAVLNISELSICAREGRIDTVLLSATAGFEDPGLVSLEQSPEGVSVSFSSTNLGADQTIEAYIEIDDTFSGSTGEVIIRVENDLGPNIYPLPLSIFRSPPAAPNGILPLNGVTGVNFDVTFEWSETAPIYTLEISEIPSFNGPIRMVSDIGTNIINLRDFASSTTYYWRIKALNSCGESSYSSLSSFTTGQITCQTYEDTDLPKDISLVPNTISSVINVSSAGVIADVNVRDITGTHTWIRDLTFTLISPAGTMVTLVETPCDDEDNFRASFDDESENINLDCPLTTGRSFKPVEPLSAFNGENPAGDWTLSVEDGVSEDGGALSSWTLELCINESQVKNLIVSPSIIELCDKTLDQIDLNLTLGGDWTSPNLPMISTGSGISIGAVVSPSPIGDSDNVMISIGNPTELVGQDVLTVSFDDEGVVVVSDIPIIHTSTVIKPSLLLPNDQTTGIPLQPTLHWNSGLLNTGTHRVMIARDEALTDIVVDQSTELDSLVVSEELDELTQYYWQVSSIGPCADSSSVINSFMTDMKVATIDNELAGIELYPSPVQDLLTIDLGDLLIASPLYVEIISLEGREIFSTEITAQRIEVPVYDLASGLYLVTFVSQKGTLSKKIMVSR